ncbi:MAG: T9SS type A sorting domain-containing protein, partial [Draconibacterium sp.]|nr:T9SS type A sorting domain-containing protein [Draconibacterium sp.]
TLSADGTWLSSDYYLRVAGAATAMLKSSETPSGTVSIVHSTGPVYYRNSFESRFTTWERNGVKGEGYQKLDPCFYKDAQLVNSNISNPVCQIEMDNTNAKSGDFMVKFSGTHTTEGSAAYAYKISEVKIPVTDRLVLSFWKKTLDELGKYVSIDLYFESGKKLSQLPAYKDQNNVAMSPGLARGNIGVDYEQFTSLIGTGELIGDEINGIGLAYEGASTTGSYNAIIDDILLSTDIEFIPSSISEQLSESADRIRVEGRVLDFSDFDQGTSVSVFDLSARLIRSFKLSTNRVSVDIQEGIYIVSAKSDKGIYSQKVIIRN